MPDSVKCLRDIESDGKWFSKVPKRGWPDMSKIGKKIPYRSCLMEAILVIRKKIVRFEMFDEVGVKQSFKNLGNSRSESNRAIVGRAAVVTLFRNRLNKCVFPRRRISAGNKNEVKKTTKNRRQFINKFLQKSGRNAIRAWSTQQTSWAEMMMEGIGLERGWVGGSGALGIAEKRISGKVRTNEIWFISRRTSYGAIRANHWGKAGVTEVVEDFFFFFFWIRTRNIF